MNNSFGWGSRSQSRPGLQRDYVRVATLGDSATYGLGDRGPDGGTRGWARLLADSISAAHYVSLCNVAVSGALTTDVRHHQLPDAIEHAPHIASLVVGINDVIRAEWNAEHARADLLTCGAALAHQGTLLITPRFHDHGAILGLPQFFGRPLKRRIGLLNDIYDEVHERFGTLRLDLTQTPLAHDRRYWAMDRMHPSELGHRFIARQVAEMLNGEGLRFSPPSLTLDEPVRNRRSHERRELVTAGAPWLGRRFQDLAPWIARQGLQRMKVHFAT